MINILRIQQVYFCEMLKPFGLMPFSIPTPIIWGDPSPYPWLRNIWTAPYSKAIGVLALSVCAMPPFSTNSARLPIGKLIQKRVRLLRYNTVI